MFGVRLAACAALATSAIIAAGAQAQGAAGSPAGAPAHAHDEAIGHDHSHGPTRDAHDHDRAAAQGRAGAALEMQPVAGERTALALTLTDASGEPVRELITHHGRKLHVVIVSDDMQVIGHIHPQDFGEPIADGRTKVFFTFPRAGRYLVATDFLTEAGPQAEQFVVDVSGSGGAPAAPVGAAAPSVAVVEMEADDRAVDAVVLTGTDQADGYDVSLVRPQAIKAGEQTTFVYRFASKGAPVTGLRPYLDAPLHLAVVKDDLSEFLHEHGVVAGEAGASQHAHAPHGSHGAHGHAQDAGDEAPDNGAHGHAAHGYQGPATFGPELSATFSFPEPGRYYLFAQAAHGDKLLISRFPVEVEERATGR